MGKNCDCEFCFKCYFAKCLKFCCQLFIMIVYLLIIAITLHIVWYALILTICPSITVAFKFESIDLGDIASFLGVFVAIAGLFGVWKQLKIQNEQLKMDTLLKAIEPFKSNIPNRVDIHVGLSILSSLTLNETPSKKEFSYSITMARFFVQHFKGITPIWERYYKEYPRDLYEIGNKVCLVAKKIDKCDKNDSLFYAFKEFYDVYELVISEYLQKDKYFDLISKLYTITKDIDDRFDEKYFPKFEL